MTQRPHARGGLGAARDPLTRFRTGLAITAALAVAATAPGGAQTGSTAPERVAWPLVDFVVLGDSTHGVQLIVSPNLHSMQGRERQDAMTLTLEPRGTRRWAPSVAHLVDSVARLEPRDRTPFVTVQLAANLGKGGLTVSLNGRGPRDTPFLIAVAEAPDQTKGWTIYASAPNIRDLLTAIDATAQTSAFDSGPPGPGGETVYVACQLDKPPRLRDGEHPFYPLDAQSRRQEGRVLAQFIIDSSGAARPGSFRALLSDGDTFAAAVRTGVLRARFVPGMARGRAVSTLVWQWFAFRLRS